MIEVIYSNGCSHSAGGGMELNHYLESDKTKLVVDEYETQHGIRWENQDEVTYAAQLAKLMGGIEYKVEAASGGGTARVVRMAYDFVKLNWHRKDKLFLILEFPAFFQRMDFFSVKFNDWVLVNQTIEESGERTFLNATRKYHVNKFNKDLEQLDSKLELTNYLDNFTRVDIEEQKLIREIETLLSFLKFNDVKFIWFESGKIVQNKIHPSLLETELAINDEAGYNYDFHSWTIKHKLTIKDELKDRTNDLHPGYFGHKKFAEILHTHIKEKYNM